MLTENLPTKGPHRSQSRRSILCANRSSNFFLQKKETHRAHKTHREPNTEEASHNTAFVRNYIFVADVNCRDDRLRLHVPRNDALHHATVDYMRFRVNLEAGVLVVEVGAVPDMG